MEEVEEMPGWAARRAVRSLRMALVVGSTMARRWWSRVLVAWARSFLASSTVVVEVMERVRGRLRIGFLPAENC